MSDVMNKFFRAVVKGNLAAVANLIDQHGLSQGYYLLRMAVENNQTAMAKLLITRGCPLTPERPSTEDSLLHLAVHNNNIEIVEILLHKGASVFSKNRAGKTALFIAVEYRHSRTVDVLLQNGAPVNDREKDDLSLLHLACMKNFDEIVGVLLNKGAQVDARTEHQKSTPLHFAVEFGSSVVVNLLLQHGAQIDCEDNNGRAALRIAVERGELSIVDTLLKFHPDLHNASNRMCLAAALRSKGKDCHIIPQVLSDYGFTVSPDSAKDPEIFHIAVERGCLKIVNDLLEHDVDSKSLPYDGFWPLHRAIINKHEKIAQLLIHSNSEINGTDHFGKPPIFYSVQNGDYKMTQLLLGNGASLCNFPEVLNLAVRKNLIEIIKLLLLHCDVNEGDEHGRSALHCTVFDENEWLLVDDSFKRYPENVDISAKLEIVRLLLSKGANVDSQTKTGLTTLHAAIMKGYASMVDLILKNNANIHLADYEDTTPLHVSAVRGNVKICTALMDRGAEINAKKMNGNTALHLAASNGHENFVKLFLDSGALVNSKGEDGKSPLHSAAERGNPRIIEALLMSGSCVNAITESKGTALHVAALHGHEVVVRVLLNNGAHVNCKDENGATPLHLAAVIQKPGIVDALLASGANIDSLTKDGRTAIDLAVEKDNNMKTVAKLLDDGAEGNVTSTNSLCWKKGLDRILSHFRKTMDNSVDWRMHTMYDVYRGQRGILDPVFDFLAQYRIKMDAAGLCVTEPFGLVSRRENEFNFKCQLELTSMTTDVIKDTNVSYHTVLRKCTWEVAKYLKNENVVLALKLEEYRSKYPIYANRIRSQFRKGLLRSNLLEPARQVVIRLSELPGDCVDKIMDFLSDDDLAVLIEN